MSVYHYESGYDTFWDGDGRELRGLGDATTTTPAQGSTSWWQDLISAGGQIATQVAQVKAAQQIAKTGQVPTAQLNVGVAPDTQKLVMIGGAVALGALLLFMIGKRRGR